VQFGPKAEPIAQEILAPKCRPDEVSSLLPCCVCRRRGRRGRAGDAGEFGRRTRVAESGAIVQSDLLARLSEEYTCADGGHRGDLRRCGVRDNWHGDGYRKGGRSCLNGLLIRRPRVTYFGLDAEVRSDLDRNEEQRRHRSCDGRDGRTESHVKRCS
jgi:hypothetical protein